jgi:hypothetical protein
MQDFTYEETSKELGASNAKIRKWIRLRILLHLNFIDPLLVEQETQTQQSSQ